MRCTDSLARAHCSRKSGTTSSAMRDRPTRLGPVHRRHGPVRCKRHPSKLCVIYHLQDFRVPAGPGEESNNMHAPIKYVEKGLSIAANGAWVVFNGLNQIQPRP